MKRINWMFLLIILIGFVIGGLIGTCFNDTILNYGQTFGLTNPIELDLGFIILTFGLKIQISIASVLGVLIALLVYRFIK